jgi:hypothetical protein
MKFVIRDDDLNYYSTPADIERWYADIFAEGIPVGFAAIPFITEHSDVYVAQQPEPGAEYRITENKELCEYLRSHKHIEVLQHGTTHATVNGVFEYQNTVPKAETLRGRKELELATGKPVTIFVPPHDWIGTSGIFSVEYAGMNIIRGRGAGLRNRIWRGRYVRNFFHMLWFKLSHRIRGVVPAYPHVLDFGKHKEVCSYRLEDRDIIHGLEYAHQTDGIFVVVLHVHFITEEKKALLHELIARAKQYGAAFVRPSELFLKY